MNDAMNFVFDTRVHSTLYYRFLIAALYPPRRYTEYIHGFFFFFYSAAPFNVGYLFDRVGNPVWVASRG